jgi:hypothetical protein
MTGVNMGTRIAEAICGVLAAALGGAGLAFALFASTIASVGGTVSVHAVPICVPTPCPEASVAPIIRETITHRSIADGGISGGLVGVVMAVVAVLVVIALGAVLHSITSWTPWLVLLLIATGLLLFVTVLTGFSIGFAFLPADALAVAASALGLARLLDPPRPVTLPGP